MGGSGSGGHNRRSKKRKKIEGNAGKRKSKRSSRAHSGPLGAPPAHFEKSHIAVWEELSSIIPAGVVESSDRWTFELLVCLMAKFRRGMASAGETNQIASLLGRFGMTPSDRGRVTPSEMENKKKHDPLAAFLPR